MKDMKVNWEERYKKLYFIDVKNMYNENEIAESFSFDNLEEYEKARKLLYLYYKRHEYKNITFREVLAKNNIICAVAFDF